ncbi:hypothetical protein BSKO_06548 [Bryopsis sp. KO-2023]|nr:hypothetical protein BSKO_06548 [Bryopsis sp. KO-2023]
MATLSSHSALKHGAPSPPLKRHRHRHAKTTVRSQRQESDNSPNSIRKATSNRRETVLLSTFFPLLAAIRGSDDTTTIVNSFLSAYGLPTFRASKGYKAYDQFEDDYYFEYPKSWVVVPNRLRGGVYISDFQTADKATVEEFPLSDVLPNDDPVLGLAVGVVAKFVTPADYIPSDRLELPPKEKIKYQRETIDGQEYLYVQFPSSTITRSGYQVKRKNAAVAAVRKGSVYALCASARSEQATPKKEAVLEHVVQSFRMR